MQYYKYFVWMMVLVSVNLIWRPYGNKLTSKFPADFGKSNISRKMRALTTALAP